MKPCRGRRVVVVYSVESCVCSVRITTRKFGRGRSQMRGRWGTSCLALPSRPMSGKRRIVQAGIHIRGNGIFTRLRDIELISFDQYQEDRASEAPRGVMC